MKADFTIRRRRPWRNGLLLLLGAAFFAAGSYFFYIENRSSLDAGYAKLEAKRAALGEENAALNGQIEELLKENADLNGQIAILERSRQIDAKAYSKVDDHLKQLQNEILTLREELGFYRGIVSSEGSRGISIHTFVVEKEGTTDAYRYFLVLTRNMRNDKVISGKVDLSISGEMNGDLKQLTFKEVSMPAISGLEFAFKHFQRLEGRMQLPQGFVPHRVYVKVITAGKRPANLEKTFDWSSAVG